MEVMGMTLLLAIVLVIVAVWLVLKAVELVARQIIAHPENMAMRAAVGIFVLLASLVLLTGAQHSALNALAVMALMFLTIAAKIVELYYDYMLQQDVGRDYVLDQVLNDPWWSLDSSPNGHVREHVST
jgi:heme A synthase